MTRVPRLWPLIAPWIVLWIATLACTSNDTLFIQLTATPPPTPSKTPLAAATRFKVGDKPVFVAVTSPMTLLASPNANDKSGSADLCFSSTQVTITDAAQTDQVTYYKIKCASSAGWAPEQNLTPLKPGTNATLTADQYLTNDPEPDATSNRAASAACQAGASVGVLDLALNPADKLIYVQVQCGTASGWLPGTTLEAAR